MTTTTILLKKAEDSDHHWWLMCNIKLKPPGMFKALPLEALHEDVLSDWLGVDVYKEHLAHQPAGKLVELTCAIGRLDQ